MRSLQAAGAFWMFGLFAVLSSALPGTLEGSTRRGRTATGAAKENLHLPGLQPGFDYAAVFTAQNTPLPQSAVGLAVGEPVIKCPSPLNVPKDTHDHRCY